MNVKQDHFMFNVTSANKTPGSGVMEYVNNKHIYKDLSKIPEWRKMLSNEYICDIEIDEITWPSLENYLIAECFYKDSPDYDSLQLKDTVLTKYRNKMKHDSFTDDILYKGLSVKFSSKYNEFNHLLRQTKTAILTHWKRGAPVLTSEDERYVEPNNFCIILMKIRDELEEKYSNMINTMKEEEKSTPVVSEPTHVTENNLQCDKLKILSKKDFDNFDDFIAKYDKSSNRSMNILTIYEKTSIIGIRMEQLSMGAEPLIRNDEANELNSIRKIALEEYKQNKLPFVICRNMPNNQKEYWKLNDMILC